jgi:hypothetical protein
MDQTPKIQPWFALVSMHQLGTKFLNVSISANLQATVFYTILLSHLMKHNNKRITRLVIESCTMTIVIAHTH